MSSAPIPLMAIDLATLSEVLDHYHLAAQENEIREDMGSHGLTWGSDEVVPLITWPVLLPYLAEFVPELKTLLDQAEGDAYEVPLPEGFPYYFRLDV